MVSNEQSAFLHCTNAVELRTSRLPRRFGRPFEGDFSVPRRQHAEGDGAGQPAKNGAARHEAEEHQHAAIAFKIRGFKDFDPGKAGAYAERGAAENAQNQTQQNQKRDLHWSLHSPSAESGQSWVAKSSARVHGPNKK